MAIIKTRANHMDEALELELLEKAFTFANSCGPAKAARWLSTASGRKISNPGLTKRMKIGVHLDR